METLSPIILKGIEILGDTKLIPENCFKELLELSFLSILNKNTEERFLGK